MSWPIAFGPDRGRGALLVGLSPDAMIQDLGGFLTGRLLETDLLPGSAVICRADPLWRPLERDGSVLFAFEGNANGAMNLPHQTSRFGPGCLEGVSVSGGLRR